MMVLETLLAITHYGIDRDKGLTKVLKIIYTSTGGRRPPGGG